MKVSRQKILRQIIQCPICNAPLNWEEETIIIICGQCGEKYDVENNVPVLLSREQKVHIGMFLRNLPAEQLIEAGASHRRVRSLQRLQRLFSPPSAILRVRAKEQLHAFLNHFTTDAVVIEVGSRSRRLSSQIINLDIQYFPEVDLVADGHHLPLRDMTADGVIVTNVLEIVEDPRQVVSEFYRILRPGGRIYAEIPFMQPYHPDPIDTQRFTQHGVRILFAPFRELALGVGEGPSSTLAWMLREYMAAFSSNFYLHRILRILCGLVVFPLKYIDYLLINKRYAVNLACGFYYIGEKNVD